MVIYSEILPDRASGHTLLMVSGEWLRLLFPLAHELHNELPEIKAFLNGISSAR